MQSTVICLTFGMISIISWGIYISFKLLYKELRNLDSICTNKSTGKVEDISDKNVTISYIDGETPIIVQPYNIEIFNKLENTDLSIGDTIELRYNPCNNSEIYIDKYMDPIKKSSYNIMNVFLVITILSIIIMIIAIYLAGGVL